MQMLEYAYISMRVTLKQVAQVAGVHQTTAKLGYRPDPMLSSLIAYRQQIRRPKYNATLAWITNHPTREGWKKQGIVSPSYQGSLSAIYRDAAEERARELGYGLETFWMREPHLKAQRLADILHARNINGLLLAPQPRARGHIRLDWSRFSVVGLGFSIFYPALHTIGNHHFDSMVKVLRELKARAYQRIGLCLFFDIDERVNNHFLAAYYFRARHSPSSEQIPHFWSRTITQSIERDFNLWFDRHRPDVIVSCNWEVLLWLLHRGIRVPEEVGFAMTTTAHPTAICSGIYDYPDRLGRMAVDHLVDMIQRGERGIPELPRRILVEGKWCDGQTVRSRARKSGKLEEQRQAQQATLRLLPIPSSTGFEPKMPDIDKWLASLPN
jgi:LacI family transcriptional regulator